MIRRSTLVGLAAVAAASLIHVHADAAPPSKEECLESHSKAQDERQSGRLADAKRMFLICAQQACPALVQSDCAKFSEELERSVPSVSFSARDARGSDLPDTQVFVDNKLVATRLDEGKAFDLDPGKHSVKFVHAGVEVVMTVVAAVGEKGRNVSATFGSAPAPAPASTATPTPTTTEPTRAAAPAASRSIVPLVIAGVGGAALVSGVVIAVVGNGKVPDACDTSTNECRAAPGDPVFDDASSAVGLANVGLGLAIGGLVVGVGGLVWYLLSSPKEASGPAAAAATLAPAFKRSGGGLQFSF